MTDKQSACSGKYSKFVLLSSQNEY